jgi:hypothetical protein
VTRRRALSTGLVLLALWAGLALAREVRHLQWRQSEGGWLDDQPCLWRYGTPPTDRLERFLDAARPALERIGGGAETVYFSSTFDAAPGKPPGASEVAPAHAHAPADQEGLCAYLWAVYLLPEATLRRAPPEGAPPAGSPWLRFRPRAGADDDFAEGLRETGGIETVLATEDGVLGRSAP